jgi:peroxiredoxin
MPGALHLRAARRFLGWCWVGAIGCASAGSPDPSAPARAPSAGQRPDAPEPTSRPPLSLDAVELRYPASKKAWLGVEIEDLPAGRPGVRVVRVLRGSPAAAGQLQVGDEISSLGGVSLNTPSDLTRALAGFEVGTEVPVSALRGGEARVFRIALRGQPEFEDLLRLAFVGLQAPAISGVVTFQGEAASLKDLRGKVVLLEFWASWCEVCRYLAPVLGRWQRAYRPAGLEVVGVTLDPPEVAALAASRAGMAYTLASDAGGQVTESYLANQIPAVFVIDRRGTVVDVMVGVQSARLDEVHALIGRLLDAPAQSIEGSGG